MRSILDTLLGSGPYAEARKKKSEIQSLDRRPNGRERKELEESNRLLVGRRRFLVKSALILSVMALGGKAILDHTGAKESSSIQMGVERVEKPAEPDREKMAREWIDSYAKIAESSTDPLPKEVLKFVEENWVLARPESNGLRILKSNTGPHWFVLANLTHEDARRLGVWSTYFGAKEGAAAHFIPDQRTILLKEYGGLGALWKGLLFGHEAFHAFDYLAKPYDWKNPSEYLAHEVLAHGFENGLLRQAGGEPYRRILEERMGRLARLNIDRPKGAPLLALPLKYDERLEEMFGPAQSRFEVDLRGTHFDIDAAFGFIDQAVPEEHRIKAKMDYMKMMYRDIEGIPK